MFREKNDLEQFLGEYLCVPLDYVVPFFYSCFPVFMDNEFWHLWATASVSWMGALKCTTHLLPLLYPLVFIINACNKCVMLVWVVIGMEWRSCVIFDSSIAPIFASSLLRWSESKIIYCFVFRVRHIYCGMTSCLPCATCMARMPLSCQFSLVFLRMISHSFCAFPSFSFLFLFSFLLPLWHFICIGVLFLLDLSSFPLCFSSKFFVLPSLLLFFYGRLLFSLVGLPLSFFFLCSVVWLSWDCR